MLPCSGQVESVAEAMSRTNVSQIWGHMIYKVKAKVIDATIGEFYCKLADGTVAKQRPDGEEIVASMKWARPDILKGKMLQSNTDGPNSNMNSCPQ